MRRGAQGHVAAPRGPARVPAWHGCDVIFICTRIIYGYSTYKHPIFGLKLMVISALPFKRASLHFFLCVGQNFLFYFDFKTRGVTRIIV